MWWKQVSNDSDVVISTRVRYARNLADFNFPNIMSESEAKSVIKTINDSLDKTKYNFFEMDKLKEINIYSLIEQRLISKEFGINSKNRALITNLDNTIVSMINEEDHLRIQSFKSGFDIDECYNNLKEFENMLKSKLEFAKNYDYGYLTACPTNLGSAMRVSVMLHLPALAKIGYLNKILEEVTKVGISVRGLYGENTTASGNIYQISNQQTLGITEEEIISNLKQITYSIIDQERKARQILKETSIGLEDSVYRAYGILKNSRNISEDEALKLLSKLRLGVSMGLVKEVDLEKVQSIMVDINSNTLQLVLKQHLEESEENIKRAEYIRNNI